MGFRYTLTLWRAVGMTQFHMLIFITTSHRNTELLPVLKLGSDFYIAETS